MRKWEILFSLLMVLVFAWAVFTARGWEVRAKFFPWAVGLPMIALSIVQLVLDFCKHRRVSPPGSTPKPPSEPEIDLPAKVVRARTLNILAWIFGFFAAIWLLGFPIAVSLIFFLYLKFQSRESWWLTLVLTAVAWGFLYGIFDKVLHLPWPQGQLFYWLGF